MKNNRPSIALVVEPRFPGGTSSAVAQEIIALAPHYSLKIYALETNMFKGRHVNQKLQDAADSMGIEICWNPKVIQDEVVVLHNPSCLRFNKELNTRILADRFFAVCHENLLQGDDRETYDVDLTLELLERATVAGARYLAPISQLNRDGVSRWLTASKRNWLVAAFDWFNICDFDFEPPSEVPRDTRGRVSRAGFEKFPDFKTLQTLFPSEAEQCLMLGADTLLADDKLSIPVNWELLPFGSVDVKEFYRRFDFFVYFTSAYLSESFGRVLAEAIAAGKLVITDPRTAASFGNAVVGVEPASVDEVIASFTRNPGRYVDFVKQAQATIALRFSSEAFLKTICEELPKTKGVRHGVL